MKDRNPFIVVLMPVGCASIGWLMVGVADHWLAAGRGRMEMSRIFLGILDVDLMDYLAQRHPRHPVVFILAGIFERGAKCSEDLEGTV